MCQIKGLIMLLCVIKTAATPVCVVFSGCLVFLIISYTVTLWLTLGNLLVRGFWGRFGVFQVLMLATLFYKDICM